MVLPSIIGMALFLRYTRVKGDGGHPMLFGGLSLITGIFWPIAVFLILFFLVIYTIGSISSPAIFSVSESDSETGRPLPTESESASLRVPAPVAQPKVEPKKIDEPAVLLRVRKL